MRIKNILAVCGISLCLGLASVIGFGVRASAEEGDTKVIRVMSIVNDHKGMSLERKKQVRREEFAGMLIRFAKEHKGIKAAAKKKLFRDVKKKGAYVGYVNLAGMKGYMRGYSNGKFEPKKPLNLAMAAYSSLKLLGYEDSELLSLEETELIRRFQTLQLNKNIHKQPKDNLTGADCMELFVNLLYAPKKDGSLLGKSLGYRFQANGSLDAYNIIMDTNRMSIARVNGQEAVKGEISAVYRNDKVSDLSKIEKYDLMYYNPSSKTLYVYSDREYGQLGNLNWNTGASAVVIGGKSFELAERPIDFNEDGDGLGLHPWREYLNIQDIREGDYVIGIKDINGKIVALEEQRLSDEKLFAYVLGNETKKLGNQKGGFDIVNTTILATSTARKMEIPSPHTMYGVGNIVSIKNDVNGTPVIVHEKDTGGSLDGKAHLLSDRLRAIEVGADSFEAIPAEMIRNADLSKLKAEYIGYNASGEIVELILRDSFGAAYQYGILKDIEGNGLTYLNKGRELYSAYDSDFHFDLSQPAFAFGFKEGKLDSIKNLTMVSIKRIKGNMALTSDNDRLFIADDADVYYKSLGEWKYDSLTDMEDLKGHQVKGYAFGKSGIIRVIVIEK